MRTIKREAAAGFEEANDALVTVIPQAVGQGIIVELTSSVKQQYGEHMEKLISAAVQAAGYKDVRVKVQDKGAWDYALQARIIAALNRGNSE